MRQQELVFGLEHELAARMSLSARYVHKQIDQAIEDVGVIDPFLGEVFYIANPGVGSATHIIGPQYPSLPKVKRDYDAFELKLRKRFSDRWEADASYTLSRLYGNYPGLASSDEVARTSPNVTRLFDAIYMAFDDHSEPVFGRLNTDRPHQFKANLYYQFPTLTGVGLTFIGASGIPISRQTNMVSSTPVFYNGRLTDGRTPIFNQTNLQIQQDVRLPGSEKRFQVSAVITNLFDQSETLDVFRNYTRDIVPISDDAFFAGFDINQILAANPALRLDPRYLLPNTFQAARAIRIGASFRF
jgi:hypothetical protein